MCRFSRYFILYVSALASLAGCAAGPAEMVVRDVAYGPDSLQTMDMSLVDVSRNQKCVLPLRKTHGQLIADFIGFLRRNFPRFEGLADLVGNHIMLLRPSGHLQILAFGEKEFLIGSLRVTLVGADIFATVGFLCIL